MGGQFDIVSESCEDVSFGCFLRVGKKRELDDTLLPLLATARLRMGQGLLFR